MRLLWEVSYMAAEVKIHLFCFGCGRFLYIKVVPAGQKATDVTLKPCDWCGEKKVVAL